MENNTNRAKKPVRRIFIILGIILGVIVVCGILAVVLLPYFSNRKLVAQYNQGAEYLEQGKYEQARAAFLALGEYEDAPVLVVYAEKAIAYTEAKESMNQEDFDHALDGFETLSGFKDSDDLAEECRHALSYEKGKALYDEGDYEGALKELEAADGYGDSLAIIDICRLYILQQDVADAMDRGDYILALSLIESEAGEGLENRETMIAECNMGIKYAEAEEAFADELYYTAYKKFSDLGDYRDAQSRAQACVLDYPPTGETYHNPAYYSSETSLEIDPNSYDGSSTYFKIYAASGSEDVLVTSVFINSGATATVWLPAGTYIFKSAVSFENWYGEKEMFGSDGVYQRLKNSDDSDYFTMDPYEDYILTLYNADNGNVGSQPESREGF